MMRLMIVAALALLIGLGSAGLAYAEDELKTKPLTKAEQEAFDKKFGEAINRMIMKSAHEGEAQAQYLTGNTYHEGSGVTQDDREAVKWYRKAAAQGHGDAQFMLGSAYHHGSGVLQNYNEALKWYRKVVAKGDANAQNNLGAMYDKGQGVLQDYVLAHMWFNIAALNGDMKAPNNRDIVASKMSAAQVDQAQKLTRKCVARKYRRCGR